MCGLAKSGGGSTGPQLGAAAAGGGASRERGELSIQECLEEARRRWRFAGEVMEKYRRAKEGRAKRKAARDRGRAVKYNVKLGGSMKFMGGEGGEIMDKIRERIMVAAGFETILAMRATCKGFKEKIGVEVLEKYAREIEKVSSGIRLSSRAFHRAPFIARLLSRAFHRAPFIAPLIPFLIPPSHKTTNLLSTPPISPPRSLRSRPPSSQSLV